MDKNKVLGIVCPLKVEAESLLNSVTVFQEKRLDGFLVYHAKHAKHHFWIIVSGIGKVKTAKATRCLIEQCAPDYLINFGTAGGLAPNVKVGEIIISHRVIQYDEQPASIYLGDSSLIQLALGLPGVKVGIIACAEKNIDIAGDREKLWLKYNALCCDWESATVLQEAGIKNIPAIAFRVITDIGQKPLKEEFEENYSTVLEEGIKVLLQFIKKI